MSASSGNPYFDMPGGTKQWAYISRTTGRSTGVSLLTSAALDKDYNLVGANGGSPKAGPTWNFWRLAVPYAALPRDDSKNFSPRIGFASRPNR